MSLLVNRLDRRSGAIQRFPYLKEIQPFPLLTAQREHSKSNDGAS
jgi:hypothetical protein